jgi:hypothetical protein
MRNPVRDATAGLATGNMHKHVSEEMQEEEDKGHNNNGEVNRDEKAAKALAFETVTPSK